MSACRRGCCGRHHHNDDAMVGRVGDSGELRFPKSYLNPRTSARDGVEDDCGSFGVLWSQFGRALPGDLRWSLSDPKVSCVVLSDDVFRFRMYERWPVKSNWSVDVRILFCQYPTVTTLYRVAFLRRIVLYPMLRGPSGSPFNGENDDGVGGSSGLGGSLDPLRYAGEALVVMYDAYVRPFLPPDEYGYCKVSHFLCFLAYHSRGLDDSKLSVMVEFLLAACEWFVRGSGRASLGDITAETDEAVNAGYGNTLVRNVGEGELSCYRRVRNLRKWLCFGFPEEYSNVDNVLG